MKRRRPDDIHVNHERWLVSYADFVTLLFAFFVVMYSVSQVNETKYQQLSSTLTELFSRAPQVLDVPPVVDAEQQRLEAVVEKLSEQLTALSHDKQVQIDKTEDGLQISLRNSLLFPWGSAKPSVEAQSIIKTIAATMGDLDNPVQVEGFADKLVISSQRLPGNWELSLARSIAVVKLLAKAGVDPNYLSVVGYNDYQSIRNKKAPKAKTSPPVDTKGQLKPTALKNGDLLFSNDPERASD